MYEVILLPKAEKVYASSEQALAKKLARCFRVLEDAPRRHPNIKVLKGELAGHTLFPQAYFSHRLDGEDELRSHFFKFIPGISNWR